MIIRTSLHGEVNFLNSGTKFHPFSLLFSLGITIKVTNKIKWVFSIFHDSRQLRENIECIDLVSCNTIGWFQLLIPLEPTWEQFSKATNTGRILEWVWDCSITSAIVVKVSTKTLHSWWWLSRLFRSCINWKLLGWCWHAVTSISDNINIAESSLRESIHALVWIVFEWFIVVHQPISSCILLSSAPRS